MHSMHNTTSNTFIAGSLKINLAEASCQKLIAIALKFFEQLAEPQLSLQYRSAGPSNLIAAALQFSSAHYLSLWIGQTKLRALPLCSTLPVRKIIPNQQTLPVRKIIRMHLTPKQTNTKISESCKPQLCR